MVQRSVDLLFSISVVTEKEAFYVFIQGKKC